MWEYRDLLMSMSSRDIQLRYRQTALGPIWVVLQPLMAAGVFSFIFTSLAGFPTHGVPPMVFTYAGILAWGVFNGFFGKASGAIVGNMGLVTKVYFPRLILPLTGVLSTLLDFLIGFAVLIVLMIVNRFAPPFAIVALPVILLGLLATALGLSLFVSAVQVKYRDISYVVPVMMNLLFYLSPVGYALSEVGKKIPPAAQGIYNLNPFVAYLEMARWSMLGTAFPSWGLVLYSSIFTLVVLVGGALFFKTQERGFADVI